MPLQRRNADGSFKVRKLMEVAIATCEEFNAEQLTIDSHGENSVVKHRVSNEDDATFILQVLYGINRYHKFLDFLLNAFYHHNRSDPLLVGLPVDPGAWGTASLLMVCPYPSLGADCRRCLQRDGDTQRPPHVCRLRLPRTLPPGGAGVPPVQVTASLPLSNGPCAHASRPQMRATMPWQEDRPPPPPPRRRLVKVQDAQKMIVFMRFLFNEKNLKSYCRDEWLKVAPRNPPVLLGAEKRQGDRGGGRSCGAKSRPAQRSASRPPRPPVLRTGFQHQHSNRPSALDSPDSPEFSGPPSSSRRPTSITTKDRNPSCYQGGGRTTARLPHGSAVRR